MLKTDPLQLIDTRMPLRDGRTLAYAEYGTPGGRALLYFHGGADSRLEAGVLAEQARKTGIRLIGIDRPGMGRSSFQKRRCLLDWPDDVVELADYLGIERFSVLGVSAGGPYALACAYKIPDRLLACGIAAGEWHRPHAFSLLAALLPWLLLPIVGYFFRDEEHARSSLLRFTKRWPEADRHCLARSTIRDLFVASLVEAFAQGTKGPAYDGMVVRRPWRFKLEAITLPALYLWHGEQDKDVPVAAGRAIADQLVQCKATYYPSDGHFSLLVNHGEEMLTTLLPDERQV
jgi:pimeloyl-ACP methyl ester carboxylesterase